MLSVLRESVAQMGGPGSGRLKLNASIEIDMLPPPSGALPLDLKARPVTSILQSQLDWELVRASPPLYFRMKAPHLCIKALLRLPPLCQASIQP